MYIYTMNIYVCMYLYSQKLIRKGKVTIDAIPNSVWKGGYIYAGKGIYTHMYVHTYYCIVCVILGPQSNVSFQLNISISTRTCGLLNYTHTLKRC